MVDGLNSVEDGGLFPRLQHRYGLRADPLDMDTPFFPDASRQHALETLRHLCGFGDMALVLTGAVGSGKTRLLGELIRSEAARLDFHRLPTAALTSPQALARDLRSVARSAIAPDDGPREAVFKFFRWTQAKVRKGQRMVLLIDDADKVPSEVSRLILSGFLASERAMAAVPVFSGTEALLPLLDVDEDTLSVHHLHLRPLGKSDIYAYLEPRIQRAGGPVSELLSNSKLERLHTLSQGSFGRLKRITPGVWLDMVAEKPGSRKRTALSWRQFAWPALALIILAGSWWLVSLQYDYSVADQSEPKAKPEPVRKSVTVGPDAESAPEPEPEKEAVEPASLPAADKPEPMISTEPPPVVSESSASARAEPLSGEARASEPEAPETTDGQADSVPVETADAVTDNGGVTESASVPEQDRIKPESEPEPAEPAFTPALPARFVDLDRLRDRKGWTIQLIAGHLESTALNLIRQYPDLDGLAYTRSKLNDKPWFMVVYGDFVSSGAAHEAVQSLPEALRKQSPWVRRSADL